MTRDKLIEELGEYLLAPSATKNTCQECYDACEKCEDKMVEFVRQAITQLKADAQEIDTLRGELEEARDLISEWKLSSGLVCGGDPDGITPAAAEDYWENVEVERDTLQQQNAELRVESEDEIARLTDLWAEITAEAMTYKKVLELHPVIAPSGNPCECAACEDARKYLTPQPNLPGDVIQPKCETCGKKMYWDYSAGVYRCDHEPQPKKEECDCWPEHDVWGDHKHEEDCSSLKAQPKKEECPECGGDGHIYFVKDETDRVKHCPKCGGSDE